MLKLDKTAEALAVLDDVIRRHPGYEGRRFLLKNAATLAVKLGDNAKLDYYTKLLPPSDAAAGSRKK